MKKINALGFESYTYCTVQKLSFFQAVCLGFIIFGTIGVLLTDHFYVATLTF